MISFYRPPTKANTINTSQRMKITDDSEFKDAIYNKNIYKAKVLSFKNSNIKDESFKLFKTVSNNLLIIELDLSQNFSFVTDAAIQIICDTPIMQQLKILNIADNQITDDSLVVISRCSWMNKLQQLILYGNSDITSEGVIILAQSPYVRRLKSLDLHATSVDDEGISYFLKGENCCELGSLNLNMSWKRITNKTLYSFSLSKHCNKLKALYLQDCLIGDIGLDELSESQNSLALETLVLNNSIKEKNNIITDKGLSHIAFSKYLINLKNLQLRNTDVTAKGIKTLSVSMACEKIEVLRLSHCKLMEEEVLAYIQKILAYQSLKKIYLNEARISPGALQEFEARNPQTALIY